MITARRDQEGGWITFPFIAGSVVGMTLATSGVSTNLIVYLIQQYNIKSVDAAQISNILLGSISIAPVFGAIICDSFFACFPVVAVSTFVSFLSIIVFTLTAALPSLRPTPCAPRSSTCQAASTLQLLVLYAAMALMSLGAGGTKFNIVLMGANQFDTAGKQDTFFNWYFLALYASLVVGSTALVYVEDTVSWVFGFGACAVAGAASVAVLLLGAPHYRRTRPEGSPFTSLARVVVAALRKYRKVKTSTDPVDYYYGAPAGVPLLRRRPPTASFRCLNGAAVKTGGDTDVYGSVVVKPWRLCTVEQVEDLKTILRILPLWSTSIFVWVSMGMQVSLTVLQALTVDRSLGPHFSIPAGSLGVSSFAATAVSILFFDRCAFPVWRKLITSGRDPTPLQRIGVGQVVNVVALASSALVERRRIRIVRAHHLVDEPGSVVPMSVLWLLLPLTLAGVGEAAGYPGQVALYYQEFPAALRSSAMGLVAIVIALGFYLSTAVIDLVRRVTNWLPDNLNASKLDRVYWVMAVGGVLNFGLYMMCASAYVHQSAVTSSEKKEAGTDREERLEPSP